jgi:pyridoxamine 5'-phosphate oxidase
VSSQIGAWSSPQSKVIPDRTFLENLFETNTQKFASGKVPLPPHWGGYIVHPTQIEFWQGRSSRLHDRIRYTLTNNEWIKERLAP